MESSLLWSLFWPENLQLSTCFVETFFSPDASSIGMSKTKPVNEPKVPLIEQVAELAMRLGRPYLADYGATRRRHDFTQRQLMSCLILRAYLKNNLSRSSGAFGRQSGVASRTGAG